MATQVSPMVREPVSAREDAEYLRLMRACLDGGDARIAAEKAVAEALQAVPNADRALAGARLAENAAWRAFHAYVEGARS